jgi:hypothetical protein
MPFPFIPIGAFVAGLILSAALTVFILSLKALDRAATQAGSAIVGGLVSGIRDWSDQDRARVVSPAAVEASPSEAATPLDEALPRSEPADAVAVEPVPIESVHRPRRVD